MRFRSPYFPETVEVRHENLEKCPEYGPEADKTR
jgi:hypothetical protein